MQKKMLGDTIYRLRKEKGLSQTQLGEAVGVSNKAVSKWETSEANPDIALLPPLAKTLGVTIDELLTGLKAPMSAQRTFFGMPGTVTETPERYEFVSDKKTGKGLPHVHVHVGKTISTMNAKARGLVAIGNNAKGIVGIGLVSTGVVSIGLVSMGFLAIGVFTLALISIGAIAFGGLALGAIAVGVMAMGAIAVGFVSLGAVSIGYFAHTVPGGHAWGRHVFYIWGNNP